MQILPSLLLVPTILSSFATAADQIPLKEKASGWLDKAKAYIPTSVPPVPNPVDAGAAKVAEYKVEKINIRNWQRKLGPKPDEEEEWMVYLTGGNKTCFGRCDPVDRVWNASVPLLSALPRNPPNVKLHLGVVNCEIDNVLCTAWAGSIPGIFHFIFPQSTSVSGQPLSPLHEIPLNITSVTTADIISIPRAASARYTQYPEYHGVLHPFDGLFAQYGVLIPFGYVLWGFGSTPSWLMMIGISFFSRQMMARRTGQRVDAAAAMGAGPARPAAAGAAAPAGGAGSGARAAAGGSAKKRK